MKRHFALCLLPLLLLWHHKASPQEARDIPFYNPQLSDDVRVADLIGRLTLPEKISQMQHASPAIARLGIPAYNWWNECLHGVARNGVATVFPQAIGMAATFDVGLIGQEAEAISTEARAKYADAQAQNLSGEYQGLTFWSPNINIFRDPRWGRGQETYGEDPLLTSEIGNAFVRGLQGDHPRYLKVIATAKHFAVHSGPEPNRHAFDAWPPQGDLYNTYLPAFEALVTQAHVYSVMSAYNRLYGVPASANSFLLGKLLRGQWKFAGYVVSDCWAVSDFYNFQGFTSDAARASVMALGAGCDLVCGNEYTALLEANEKGWLDVRNVDTAISRLFKARIRLGQFDPPGQNPYASILPSQNNTPSHSCLALQVARESMVLLQNKQRILPLARSVARLALIGPYANDTSVLLGNYHGEPSAPVTLFQALDSCSGKDFGQMLYAPGVATPEQEAIRREKDPEAYRIWADSMQRAALQTARDAEAIIFSGGISPYLEGEALSLKIKGFEGGDRTNIDLPQNQIELLKALQALGKPIIVILNSGSAFALKEITPWVDAIIQAWYPGQQGGNAIADVVFGRYNPAGRLPVTFYAASSDLPAFDDYRMQGRTYRYFAGKPTFEFGYGLSYTQFEYSGLETHLKPDTLEVSFLLANTGERDGDEVAQVYVRFPDNVPDKPTKTLLAFQRINVPKGEKKQLHYSIPLQRMRYFIPSAGEYKITSGQYILEVGASSCDIRLHQEIEIKN